MAIMRHLFERLGVFCIAAQLTFASAAAGGPPAVYWFNDPVGPDETVLVTGADLNTVTAATIRRIPDAGESPAGETAVALLQANASSLKFVVPPGLGEGVYVFTLAYPGGTISQRLNVPTIYWTQSDGGRAASPDGWIEIFGRNIVRRAEHARLRLVAEKTGTAVHAELRDGSFWRARFHVPADAPPGSYRLRLFNGNGGEDEWADAGSVEIRTPPALFTQSFDVRAFGAIGDGTFDSTKAVVAAMDGASRAGGGTVFFPRGRYFLSDKLNVPPGVRLKGERTDLVNLVWPDFATAPEALIKGTRRFAVEDLTIYASNHLHIISGGFLNGDFQAPNAADMSITRVRIRASAFRGILDAEATHKRMMQFQRAFPSGAPDAIRLSGDNVEVRDCDVLSSGNSLLLFKVRDGIIAGNVFNNGRNGNYLIKGSQRVVFEKNAIASADLQAAGGGISTVSNWLSASDSIFIGHNTFKAIYGWDREAMTSDGPAGYYYGHALSDAPHRMTLLDQWSGYPVSPDWTGALVLVVDGRGAGQFARIAATEQTPARSKKFVTLDRDLQTSLDASSIVTIAQAQQNYLVVGNTFEDTGVAAQSFGTALGHVFADNTATRSSGFFAIGLNYGHMQPSWHVQILDNRIVEGNVYRAGPERDAFSTEAAVGIHAYQTQTGPGAPALARAIVVRGNQLEQDAHLEVKGFSPASPGVRDVVLEANTIGASRIGILVDKGVASLLNRRNVVKQRIPR